MNQQQQNEPQPQSLVIMSFVISLEVSFPRAHRLTYAIPNGVPQVEYFYRLLTCIKDSFIVWAMLYGWKYLIFNSITVNFTMLL